jgi:hypothetical protein
MIASGRSVQCLVCIVGLALACTAAAKGQPTSANSKSQTASPTDLAQVANLQSIDEQQGPFALGDQNYTVVLHSQRLTSPTDRSFSQTLDRLEIRDATGNVAYEKSVPFAVTTGRFQQNVSASVERLAGKTGAGLLVHYTGRTSALQSPQSQANESWQLFAFVNGKLAPLGKPATIGEPAPGGPFMGVMMRAVNGTVSVISQPDTIEVRAWMGNFYVFVPLRVDWSHGGLAQGQRCVERLAGPLQDVGCPMRVEVNRKPPAGEFSFVRLFTEANENMGSAEHVVLQKDSKVEILGSSAITVWNENGGNIQPIFSDVWLQVRIADRSGWIHGEDDFAAIGLPAGNPEQ